MKSVENKTSGYKRLIFQLIVFIMVKITEILIRPLSLKSNMVWKSSLNKAYTFLTKKNCGK